MAWAKKAWEKINAAYRAFMEVWESPLSVIGGLLLGALASLLVVAEFDRHQTKEVCSFEMVSAAFADDQKAIARQNWSDKACGGVLGSPDKVPEYFRGIFEKESLEGAESKLQDRLREKLDAARSAESRLFQFYKVCIAAIALLWLYVFNVDAFRRTRFRPGGAGPAPEAPGEGGANNGSPGSKAPAAGSGSASVDAPRPRLERRAKLSRNRWALVCYGFAASACVYFTASTAGTAAANVITSNTYNGGNIQIEGGETSREIIRELHFARFLERDVDPRAYDRLAWHFFFEEGARGSCRTTDRCAGQLTDAGLKFRGNLSGSAIPAHLREIIKSLAACASDDKPVKLKVTAQSSRRRFCGCSDEESKGRNAELAEKRAEKIRTLFKEALATVGNATPGFAGKVILEDGVIDPYPFDFSDEVFHGGNSIPAGQSVPPSPYYLAQSAALVLEDPSNCAILKNSDGGPAQ